MPFRPPAAALRHAMPFPLFYSMIRRHARGGIRIFAAAADMRRRRRGILCCCCFHAFSFMIQSMPSPLLPPSRNQWVNRYLLARAAARSSHASLCARFVVHMPHIARVQRGSAQLQV